MTEDERIRMQLEVWKTTVGVQQHFNDIEMRVRALGITLVTAVLAAAGFALRDGNQFEVAGVTIKLATVLAAAAIVVWFMFYMVDQWWYHRLLIGAVRHGEDLEDLLNDEVPGIGLTHRISEESPYPQRYWFKTKKRENVRELHSAGKLRIFYMGLGVGLLLLFSASLVVDAPARRANPRLKPVATTSTTNPTPSSSSQTTTPAPTSARQP